MNATAGCQRVLLVDDEPMLLSAVRRLIERVCPTMTVVYALNPASAIWQLQNTTIALVLTDMRMEGREDAGWPVVDAAQSLDVPVVVISGADVRDSSPTTGRRVEVRPKHSLNRKNIEELLAFAQSGNLAASA